jgi:hypothetical protein
MMNLNKDLVSFGQKQTNQPTNVDFELDQKQYIGIEKQDPSTEPLEDEQLQFPEKKQAQN